MKHNYLLLKYVAALVIFAVGLYIVHNYKVSQYYDSVYGDIVKVEQDINKELEDTYKLIDVIYDATFSNNQFVHNLYRLRLAPQAKQRNFEQQFAKELSKFKSYAIKRVVFYTSSGHSIFSNEHSFLAKHVAREYEEIRSFEVVNNALALRVVKPHFDSKMRLLGSVEFVLDAQQMLYEFNKNHTFTSKLIFTKAVLEKYASKETLNSYEVFESHKSYLVKPSVYDSFEKIDNIYKMAFSQQNDLITLMAQQKVFAKSFQYDDNYYSMTFIPIVSKLTQEKMGYFISYEPNWQLSKLLKQHTQNMILISVCFLLVLFLLFSIHQLKLQQKRIQRAYESLRHDIDNYVIMTETDKQGIITYVSQAFCMVSGYKKDDLIGRPQNIVRHPDISKDFYKNMWDTLNKGEIWEGEIKNMDKNGNSYWIRGIIVPIFDEYKKIMGYRSIRVNITDEKQLEKVNTILKDDLSMRFNEIKTKDKVKMDESKIELMSKMLDAFANEWKKPISYISLKNMDLETRLKTSIPNKGYLEKFTHDINDLIKKLSNNLNQFKYIFHNQNIKERYNVYEEVEHAIFALQKNKEIIIELTGEKSHYSYGIANDLNKIVSSLLNNAIEQFEIKNIKNGQINIAIQGLENSIEVRVMDNALGIPPDIIDKIFEPDFSTKLDFTSKGLSLYISKLMLQKNGGNLSVENIENGSCFIIELISKDRRKGVS